MKKTIIPFIAIFLMVFTSNCSKDGDVNLFTVKQDIEFGKQVDSLVHADYNVLPRNAANAEAYAFLDNMMNDVLSSEEILYRDKFPWEITIVDEDVLNAFAAPGGKLYFYTGLMKYLENSAELAGVLAHEIAHSDRRHSTENMTKAYGLSILVSVVLGKDPSKLEEIVAGLAQGLAGLEFSRNHELEADEYAVRYNQDTKYLPTGVAGFFEKMMQQEEGGSNTPVFLSTHPADEKRIEEVYNLWNRMGSPQGEEFPQEYEEFKSHLP